MTMPANLFVSAFREQRLGLMFSIIMVIMVFLGSLAMAAQATLVRTSASWGYNLQNRYTIEVPSIADETMNARHEKAQKIADALSERAEVAAVTIMPEQETAALIKQWVKDPALLSALPLPTLIDVDVKVGRRIDPTELSDDFNRIVAGIQVHSHSAWMDKLQGFLKGLGYLAGIMLLLTAIALVASIIVICRAAMAVQHETIELLHFMGASDRAIASQFQKHIQVLAIPAALLGFVLAVITVGLLALLLSSLGGLSLIAPLSWVTVAIVMSTIPVGAFVLAILTARLSVQKFLRRLL